MPKYQIVISWRASKTLEFEAPNDDAMNELVENVSTADLINVHGAKVVEEDNGENSEDVDEILVYNELTKCWNLIGT